ncbi:hypothetical protein [Pseudoalteromonas sp. MMG005]|uniref:hypothetical protein n=1 Tax=Pseudoalteromonas sp. MMG005 TaxID=2822682 RepID=UPI001B39EA34|nr:hypothetical protein [Pseudoalteromonas sp. MMG005]MBQ4844713.1 hypothetical protein [Pseudoalteromonas sp. MMG005]
MEQIGIYEQLITQVVEQNLNRERFYVGERVLESAEAATWLSRFLAKLVEHAINAIPNSSYSYRIERVRSGQPVNL